MNSHCETLKECVHVACQPRSLHMQVELTQLWSRVLHGLLNMCNLCELVVVDSPAGTESQTRVSRVSAVAGSIYTRAASTQRRATREPRDRFSKARFPVTRRANFASFRTAVSSICIPSTSSCNTRVSGIVPDALLSVGLVLQSRPTTLDPPWRIVPEDDTGFDCIMPPFRTWCNFQSSETTTSTCTCTRDC